MANLRDIRRRIKSAKNIQQIGATSALTPTAKRYAQYQGMLCATANGIAPRNSEIGIKDKTAVQIKIAAVLMLMPSCICLPKRWRINARLG